MAHGKSRVRKVTSAKFGPGRKITFLSDVRFALRQRGKIRKGTLLKLKLMTVSVVGWTLLSSGGPPAPTLAATVPAINVYDGFETARLSEAWDTSRFVPSAVTMQSDIVRAGRGAVKIVVRANDKYEAGIKGNLPTERAELMEARELVSKEGDNYEYSFSMFIPPDFPLVPTRLVIAQWKQYCPGGGCLYDSPIVAVRYASGVLRITHKTGPDQTTLYETKEELRGRWLDFIFQLRFSSGANGRIKAWLNNKQVVDYTGVNAYPENEQTGFAGPGWFYFKMGLYRDLMAEPMTIYIDEYRKKELSGIGARWAGKIEERGGIVAVENPADPIHRGAALTLKEELSLGRENAGDEYSFSDISGIDADDEGRIYVLEVSDANVRVFDRNGAFLRTIGRKGQGPGEMERPVYIQIVRSPEIFVIDYAGRSLSFALDGTFLRQQPTLRWIQPIRRDSRGNIIGMEILAPPPAGGKVIRAYGPDLRPLFDIAKEEQGARGVFDVGRPGCYCAVTTNDSIVWGDSKEYVLHVLDPGGRLVRKITKPHRSVPISSEDRETFRERYSDAVRGGMRVEFRSHFPAFAGIFADDAGRIFVKTYERFGDGKGSFYFDVFDPEGRFSARVPMTANLDRHSVWKNGKLYTVETNSEGMPVIKRYKVSWNDEVR
ncbi:MAG: heparin lyase I family protein [Candidatus Aminicenantales bacterium]